MIKIALDFVNAAFARNVRRYPAVWLGIVAFLFSLGGWMARGCV